MPSFDKDINRHDQFVISVKVFPPSQNTDAYNKTSENSANYNALVDTGANRCCISEKIVTDLALRPHSQVVMMTAGAPYATFAYFVGIAVPVTEMTMQYEQKEDGSTAAKRIPVSETLRGVSQIEVTSFPAVGKDRGFDMILGMDMLVGFHITIYQGNIVISI